ncbi:MAG: M20/M25/M40 family metallo-hydrolase [Actinobacteria bacterium]|nr:M20/M25/M40 family metallo-hydrolase [Actinomycetota bacterium]
MADPRRTVDLLRHLIRNACVNDGTRDSGGESRSVEVLRSFLEGSGADMETYEAVPGRGNLVARIEGRHAHAPSLLLMGHTDVVPVNPDRWRRDPFGGELVDGEVWGRGAIDMLSLTASMAVAFRALAEEGFRPSGDLVYLAVADEEALGSHGAEWLLEHERDAVLTDFVVTEAGGFRMPLPSISGPKLPIEVGEKGSYWCTIRVSGTPGHASMPLRTDNALVKAAEVVRRLSDHRPETQLHEVWRAFVERSDLPEDLAAVLLDPGSVRSFFESSDDLGLARTTHALTHTTIAPTMLHGGVKTNVIPDSVDLQVDIRTLPGQSGEEVHALLREALGDLYGEVEITADSDDASTASPMDTPLWDALTRATERLAPGSTTIPLMSVGATDARFFRRAGATAYGAGLYSDRISFAEFTSMFHGDDERIDEESVRLQTDLWHVLARDLLG